MSKVFNFYPEIITKVDRTVLTSKYIDAGYIVRYDDILYFVETNGQDIDENTSWYTIESNFFIDTIEKDDDYEYRIGGDVYISEEILNMFSMDVPIVNRVVTKNLDEGSLIIKEKKLEVGDCYESRGVGMIISKIIGDNVYSSEVAYDENDIPYALPGTESLLTDYEILKIKNIKRKSMNIK